MAKYKIVYVDSEEEEIIECQSCLIPSGWANFYSEEEKAGRDGIYVMVTTFWRTIPSSRIKEIIMVPEQPKEGEQ